MCERIVIDEFFIDECWQSSVMSPMLCGEVFRSARRYNMRIKNGMSKSTRFFFLTFRTGQMISNKKSVQVFVDKTVINHGIIVLGVVVEKFQLSIFPINRMEGDVLTGLEVKYDESICQWKLRSEV